MPHFAPFVVLAFLGTLFLLGLSVLVLVYAAVRRSFRLAKSSAIGFLAVLFGYGLLLCGASLISREKLLPPGGWKFFCEIDCHIAYSVTSVQTAAALGPELQQTAAHGKFVVVRLKTWFDELSISPHRGNSPLTPNARRVLLVDDAGRTFYPSTEGAGALRLGNNAQAQLSQPLRPGESYIATLVFDVARDSRGLRLLITDADWISRLLIGHENSPLHGNIYLGLEGAPASVASYPPPRRDRSRTNALRMIRVAVSVRWNPASSSSRANATSVTSLPAQGVPPVRSQR
jgi:Domain of unknown function (DUF4352)